MSPALSDAASALNLQPGGVPGSLAALIERDPASDGNLARLIGADRSAVRDALYQHGALLFRGFDVKGAEVFSQATHAFKERSFSFVGGVAPRSHVSGDVYTSSDHTAAGSIVLHSEASYFKQLPEFIWFFCDLPPAAGGETPLGDMRRVLNRLGKRMVEKFAGDELMYVTNLHAGKGFGKSWQSTYQSEDKAEVERRVSEKGFEYAWMPDGILRVIMRAPAIRRHSVSGEDFWGNQVASFHPAALGGAAAQSYRRMYKDAMAFPRNVFHGDGRPVEDSDVEAIAAALAAEETTFRWHMGDTLLVDNQAIAHGRRPFTGERRILVALS